MAKTKQWSHEDREAALDWIAVLHQYVLMLPPSAPCGRFPPESRHRPMLTPMSVADPLQSQVPHKRASATAS